MKEEIEYWITVNGNHIPVKKGQTKEDAISSFLKDKGDDRGKSVTELKAQLAKDIKKKSNVIKLPPKEYAQLCSAVRTTYGNKIPKVGKIFLSSDFYRFRYNKSKEQILCTFKISIEENEDFFED